MHARLGCLALLSLTLHAAGLSETPSETTVVAPAKPNVQVMILGTFHFAQVEPEDEMLTDKRQQEIGEVLDRLAEFKPDKIFVERNPEFEQTNQVAARYRMYRNQPFELSANEIYQIGYRLGHRLGLPELHQADAPGRWGALYAPMQQHAEEYDQMALLDAEETATCMPLYYSGSTELKRKRSTTLEFLRYLNSDEYTNADHGYYVSVFPRVGDTNPETETKNPDTYFAGSKLLADWYRRNIQIYANVITQLDWSEERILIVFGAGHVSTLRHLFESNPFCTVEVTNEWLTDAEPK